ncbi:MAG: DUF4345 domain-containing protein [Cyanobacteria bacterium P01_H01_bin.58]
MKPSKFVQVLLCLTGGIAIAIGGLILLSPADFYAMNHIDIGRNVNLLSEIRAPAGALFTSGVVMILGAFVPQLTFTSLVLATLIYLSYGLSRLAGMFIDGLPVASLIWSGGIEIGLGVLCLCMVIDVSRRHVGRSGSQSPAIN